MSFCKKNLKSTFIKGNGDFLVRIKVGICVYLLSPRIFRDSIKRRYQEHMNKEIVAEAGYPPYEVLKITKNLFSKRIFFDISGEKGIKREVVKDYFEGGFVKYI